MNIVDKIINGEISSVCIDSRIVEPGCLFIPINGEKFNGNSFIKDAFTNGAICSLVERSYYEDNYKELENLNLIVVEDTLVTLLEYTREYIKKTKMKVIGITGSNGKTSTKDFLNSIMKNSKKVTATKGNFNNNIGLPLTVLNADIDSEYLILEMGMSEIGGIEPLADVTRPSIAIITNIGTSHIENLGSKENIFKTKMDITKYFGSDNILILNDEDEFLSKVESDKFKIIRFKLSDLDSYEKRIDGFYSFVYKGIKIDVNIRGFHQLYNSLLALRAAEVVGIPLEEIKEGIESYSGQDMRFTTIEKGDIRVVNDAYNSSYPSVKMALETLCGMDAKRRIVVIGDMLELGERSISEHRKIGKIPQMKEIDMVLTIGEYSKEICYYNSNSLHFNNISKLSRYLNTVLRSGDLVLVKASRGMKLERIVDLIEVKND